MTEAFVLEWMGGVAEHHYRKARPSIDDFPWDTLLPTEYPEAVVDAGRRVWTQLALSEYAAIASFGEVVSALAQAKAPLDLIGMTSDFLADEVRHVELASRFVMQLGGAAPQAFHPSRLVPRLDPGLSARQRANELALRVGCIAEAFASGTSVPTLRAATHPLVRAVYTSILRDEARHKRFGSLYFEWAAELLDDAERARLGRVALSALGGYAQLWRSPVSGRHREGAELETVHSVADIHALGWLEPARYVPVAIAVVRDEIVPSLRAIGIAPPAAELEALIL
jgi:hypothetical protein